MIVSLTNLFFLPVPSYLPHQHKATQQVSPTCTCTKVIKSLVSIKSTKPAQWEYLLKPDRSNHSAPENKSIPCWQVSGAAHLILFLHIRTACLYFGKRSGPRHLRERGYTSCPASALSDLNTWGLSSYLSTTIVFPVADCSCRTEWKLWTPSGDFSIAPKSNLAVSHWMAFPALQDKADGGALVLRQNTLPLRVRLSNKLKRIA